MFVSERSSVWVSAGAHLNWANYSPLSRLTGLTDLQLAHCSGTLPMHWLAAATGLVRLFVKGNGAAWGQTVALAGGAGTLALLDGLRELYFGLCEFTEADGPPPLPSSLERLQPGAVRRPHACMLSPPDTIALPRCDDCHHRRCSPRRQRCAHTPSFLRATCPTPMLPCT